MRWEVKVVDESPLMGDVRNPPNIVAKITIEASDSEIDYICRLGLKNIYPRYKVEAIKIEEKVVEQRSW